MAPQNTAAEFKKMVPRAVKSDDGWMKMNGFIKKKITSQQILLDCLWEFVILFDASREGLTKDQKARGLAILYHLFKHAIDLAGPLNELADFILYIDALAIEQRTGKKSTRQYRLPPNEAGPQYVVYRIRWCQMAENDQRYLRDLANAKRQKMRDSRTLTSVLMDTFEKAHGRKPTLEEVMAYDPVKDMPRQELDRAIAACDTAWRGFSHTTEHFTPPTETNLKKLDQAFERLRRLLLRESDEPLRFFQLWKWIRDLRTRRVPRGRAGGRQWTEVITPLSSEVWREVYLEACYCALRLALGKWGMLKLQTVKGLHPADRDLLLQPVQPRDRDHLEARLELGIKNVVEFEELQRIRRRMNRFGQASQLAHLDEFETVALMNKIASLRKNNPGQIENMVVQASSVWEAFRDKHRVGQSILDSFTIIWAEDEPGGQRIIVEFHNLNCQLFATNSYGLGDLVRNAFWRKMQELGDQLIAFMLAYLEIIGLVVDVISAGTAGGFRRIAFQFIKEQLKDKATEKVLDAFHIDDPALRVAAGMGANMVRFPKGKVDIDVNDTGVTQRAVDAGRPTNSARSISTPGDAAPVNTNTPATLRLNQPAANQNIVDASRTAARQESGEVVDLSAYRARKATEQRKQADIQAQTEAGLEESVEVIPQQAASAGQVGAIQMARKQAGGTGGSPVKGRGTPATGSVDVKSRSTQDRTGRPKSDPLVDDAAQGKGPKKVPNKAEADPGYPAALQYRQNLVRRYPKLANARLKPIYRNLGEPGLWEESMYTGSARLSWEATLRTPRKVIVRKGKWKHLHVREQVQLDDIDPHGFVVDTKMRGLHAGQEIKSAETPDVASQIKGSQPYARPYDPFPDSEREKLLAQLQFAKENNLSGVRWETNSPELEMEFNLYKNKVLTDEEKQMVSIKRVER